MDIYRDIIIDAAKHPHRYGKLSGSNVTSQHLNPSCGDDVTVYLKLSQDGQTVVDLAWEGHGCAISKAAMSMLADELVGKSLADIEKIDKNFMAQLLGLDEVNPGREKCMLVGLTAVKKVSRQ